MLCSHRLQASRSPSMHFYLPVRSLWSEVTPLLYQQDLLQRHRRELHSCLELMDQVKDKILEETQPVPTSAAVQPVSCQLEEQGEHFGLILDAKDFSPEELCVKQQGRRLTVSGRTEKKQEDGKGSYSYRCQQFRQQVDLPREVDPEAVSCCLAPDGKLHIQAAKAPRAEEAERELTIKRSLEEKTPAQTEESSRETDSNTQDTEDKTH